MFTAIAPRYDFLNHLLSLNIDRRWRRQARSTSWDGSAGRRDAISISAPAPSTWRQHWPPGPDSGAPVIGADFVKPMLERGRGKAARVSPVNADALDLPLPDACVDGATVGFGVRNLSDLEAGLAETARVLRPGARFVILEFTTPPRQPMRALYFLYFRHVLPVIGRLVSKHTERLPLPARVGPGLSRARRAGRPDAPERISRRLVPAAAGWNLRHPRGDQSLNGHRQPARNS